MPYFPIILYENNQASLQDHNIYKSWTYSWI